MLRRLYDWTMSLAGHRRAMLGLAFVAFVESSVFPIPPDVLLVPMVLANRERAWRIATVCTLASVVGGIVGYIIGFFLFESFGRPLLEFYGYADQFARFQAGYNHWGGWIVAIAGLTPFPYKVITIASGVTHLDLSTFAYASVLSRGARFFMVAALLWQYGPPVRAFIEEHLATLTIAFFVLLIGGFLIIRFAL